MDAPSRALRVGFLIDRWEPERGGAERCLACLARHLETRGHDVRAFALRRDEGAPGRFHPVRAPSRLAGLRRRGHERALAEALVGAALDAGCDVTVGVRHLTRVDLFWPHGGAHLRSLEARARARGRPPRAGAPRVRGRHALFLDLEAELLERGGAGRVLCVSEAVRGELAELYPAARERLVLAPNGVDLERFHPRNKDDLGARLRASLDVEPDERLFVFAAHDPELKGLASLLAAAGRLASRRWKLLVAGTRRAGRWSRLAARHGLGPDRVRFSSRLDPAALFAAADVTCLPTWRDTSSLVLLESLASGTPVVTTSLAGEASLVAGAEAGTVIEDPGDLDGLSAALESWLQLLDDDPPARGAIRRAVEHRGLPGWLAGLERHVEDAAAL